MPAISRSRHRPCKAHRPGGCLGQARREAVAAEIHGLHHAAAHCPPARGECQQTTKWGRGASSSPARLARQAMPQGTKCTWMQKNIGECKFFGFFSYLCRAVLVVHLLLFAALSQVSFQQGNSLGNTCCPIVLA